MSIPQLLSKQRLCHSIPLPPPPPPPPPHTHTHCLCIFPIYLLMLIHFLQVITAEPEVDAQSSCIDSFKGEVRNYSDLG